MPRTCTVCKHAQRDDIDRALVSGEPLRSIAERFGASATALHRHKAQDLAKALTRAAEAQELAHDKDLLKQVRELVGSAHGILAKAEGRGDFRTALMAIREARGTLELLGRITGELNAPPAESAPVPLFALPPGSEIAIAVKTPCAGTQHSSELPG